jgi:hypothetical protein
MARRGNAPLDDLFDLLVEIFRIVPPWVCIPVGIIGCLLIVFLIPTPTLHEPLVSLNPIFAMFRWFLGGIFALVCLTAGLKGWLNRRRPSPACPICGSPMVLRRARRGEHAGNRFWGCSKYPACRGIRNVG